MTYQRKTKDEYTILGNYGQGWEYLISYDTLKEARENLKLYRENEPQYPHCLKTRRVLIEFIC